ncbi:MAG TPA: DsbA family oxidoreductase [Candidatus Binataceae bacterium]|jgi:predicted DsbA family dithiol-disulfide isomerase|nr:DsbA family oxidoreductase [Candidatus Binataceae bacterium]
MSTKVVVFSDFICPFCYIGMHTLRRLQPEFGFEVDWRGFQIHPEWPAQGVPAEQYYRAMGEQRRKGAWQMIESMAAEGGLEMRPPAVLANSYLALAAQEFAREHQRVDAFEERVFRAYFHDQANIGDRAVLMELAQDVGLDAQQLDQALAEDRYAMRLKNTTLAAHQRGISGVPTFIIGDYPLVGAQSADVMRQILERAVEIGA